MKKNYGRTAEEIKRSLLDFFECNERIFNDAVEELDSWNGFLGDDRFYDMCELDDLMCGKSTTDLLNMAFFGYDLDNYSVDSFGNKSYCSFNPNRDYFCFNGYGNLVSTDYKDYSDRLDLYMIDAIIDNYDHLYDVQGVPEIAELMDKLVEAEENRNEDC